MMRRSGCTYRDKIGFDWRACEEVVEHGARAIPGALGSWLMSQKSLRKLGDAVFFMRSPSNSNNSVLTYWSAVIVGLSRFGREEMTAKNICVCRGDLSNYREVILVQRKDEKHS